MQISLTQYDDRLIERRMVLGYIHSGSFGNVFDRGTEIFPEILSKWLRDAIFEAG
jgi:hypothetical protein